VALLLLAGCGGRQPERPAYNDTDVMFLQMLLAHHEPSADLLALGPASAPGADAYRRPRRHGRRHRRRTGHSGPGGDRRRPRRDH